MALPRSLLALALPLALPVLVAACSSTPPDGGGAPTTQRAPEAAAVPSPGGSAAPAPPPAAEAPACPPDTKGYQPLTGKPARARQSACTDAEIAELTRDCLESADRYEDPRCKMHASACARCMASKESDPAWGPIVELVDGDAHGFVANQAGCIDLLTGIPGCGDALVGVQDCVDYACASDRCTDAADREACSRLARDTPTCARLAPTDACRAAYAAKGKGCVSRGAAGFGALMRAFCQAP